MGHYPCLSCGSDRPHHGRPAATEFYCSANDEVTSLFYSMFLHGGWLHLLGSMLFLWVFGDNVEDAMGHIRYALSYLVVGLAASASHVSANINELVPSIGATGAIAGVLGAYLVLFPRATVAAVFPLFILVFFPFRIPAVVLIGFWFLLQLFNGFTALATADVVSAGGGVAWFAHIGGFVCRRRPREGLHAGTQNTAHPSACSERKTW